MATLFPAQAASSWHLPQGSDGTLVGPLALATRIALTRACKQCPWKPFSRQELEMAATTWRVGGSRTGPDGIILGGLAGNDAR